MPFCCQLFCSGFSLSNHVSVFCTAQSIPVGAVVVEGLCVAALGTVIWLAKNRLIRILGCCGVEICLWQICKAVFGEEALLTRIMTWVTAGVLIVLTLAIVNSIKWHHYGEKDADDSSTDPPETGHP
jgi:hypothetical protein